MRELKWEMPWLTLIWDVYQEYNANLSLDLKRHCLNNMWPWLKVRTVYILSNVMENFNLFLLMTCADLWLNWIDKVLDPCGHLCCRLQHLDCMLPVLIWSEVDLVTCIWLSLGFWWQDQLFFVVSHLYFGNWFPWLSAVRDNLLFTVFSDCGHPCL